MASPANLSAEVAQRYLAALDDYVNHCIENDAQTDGHHVADAGACILYTVTLIDLPVEIISEIFLLACASRKPSPWWHWEHTSLRPPAPSDHPESPLKLGHICRYLRHAAWSTPALWTHIDIYPTLTATYTAAAQIPGCPERMHTNVAHQAVWLNDEFWTADDARAPFPRCIVPEAVYPRVEATHAGVKLLQEWIDRSKDLPLTIVCRREHAWPSLVRWNRFTAPIFRVLAGAAHRWAHIDAFVPYNCAPVLSGAPLATVHTASLCAVASRGRTALAQVDAGFLRTSSGLQRLQLCGFHQFSCGRADITFTYLTELRVSDTCVSTLVTLLQKTPALHTLVVRDVYDAQGVGHIAGVEFELEWLQSLNLISCTSALLEHIGRAPALRDMKFVEIAGVSLDIRTVTNFLGRSGCFLKTLELESEQMHAPSILQIVQRVPLLTTLKICLRHEDGGEVGEALGLLLRLDERHKHIPFLLHFEFHAKCGPFIGVINAVKQRWRQGHLMEARDVPHRLEAVNIEIVSKVKFLGFKYESDEVTAVIRKCMREEIDHGLILKFAKWKEVKTMHDAIAAFR